MFEFLRQVKTELQKVIWPSRAETLKYTVIVIVFSVVVALILGAMDFGLLKLFETVLSRR